MALAPGPLELLILMMMSGGLFSGGGLLGLPPGERDAAFLRCPPSDAVLYVEWTERSAGKPGAPGIDGLAADPEIRLFLQNAERAQRRRCRFRPNVFHTSLGGGDLFPSHNHV